VVLISGETGCGKTSQVPQFLLDDPQVGPTCNVVCTQPRRISAISVAERVAAERGEAAGGVVGYAVRGDAMENKLAKVNSSSSPSSGGDSNPSPKARAGAGPWPTQLSFVTPGLLLRRLGSDPTLQRYTHVLIDEVHEQDKYTEFLLVLLKRLLPSRPDLRVVLMSATLRAETFADFFGGCPGLTIGTSMYPVATYFLEDALRNTHFLERRDGVSPADWKQWHASSGGGSGMVEYGDALPLGFGDAEMNQSAADLELLSSLWRAGASSSAPVDASSSSSSSSSGTKSTPLGPATALAFPLTNTSIEPEVQRQIKRGAALTAHPEKAEQPASSNSGHDHDANNGTSGGENVRRAGEHFECVVCGSINFESAEELGAHIAECFGQAPVEQQMHSKATPQAASRIASGSNKNDDGNSGRSAIFSALGMESPPLVSEVGPSATAAVASGASETAAESGKSSNGDGSMAAMMAAAKAAAAQESAAEASAKADIAAALNQYLGGADDEEVSKHLIYN